MNYLKQIEEKVDLEAQTKNNAMIIKINPLEISEILAKAAVDNIVNLANTNYEQEILDNFYSSSFDYFFEILTNSQKEDDMSYKIIEKGTKVKIINYGTVVPKLIANEGIDTLTMIDTQPFLINREGIINKYDFIHRGYIIDGIPEKCGFYYRDQLLIID